MLISELIEALASLKEKAGDIEVTIENEGGMLLSIDEVAVCGQPGESDVVIISGIQ